MIRTGVLVFLLLARLQSHSQDRTITGLILNESNQPVTEVSIRNGETNRGTSSDRNGRFRLKITGTTISLYFSHVQYRDTLLTFTNPEDDLVIILTERTTQLKGVEIIESREEIHDEIPSYAPIKVEAVKGLPSAFGDFNKILVTLPGVASNNELSSAYSVRGGNFDENLVYVNDIPVYRPFLANAGQQEGLSFVNQDLVASIHFYAGGWEAKYGDKMSSSLNIDYKEPDTLSAGATVGLLGGSAYFGASKGRFKHTTGIRYRDSKYLLNTLETQGQYFPKYTDIQSLITVDLTRKGSVFLNKTKLNILLAYGRNRYLSVPSSSDTQFGSVQQNFRLQTFFQGREQLDYDTWQAGFRLTHKFNEHIRSHFIGSLLFTSEREFYDVDGYYRLCDVNIQTTSSTFNNCEVVRGVGSNYKYGRNQLEAMLATLESRHEILLSSQNVVEFGFGVSIQEIHDAINEYTYVDSADYVTLTNSVFQTGNLSAIQSYAYIQNTVIWQDSVHALTAGVRLNYWDFNQQLLFSPRVSYRLAPKNIQNTTFKLSVGYYQQPPFYRELRDYGGTINKEVFAQKSIHYIGGITRILKMWDRPFLFTSELYYKRLYDLIPYDIDNVRIRYLPGITANGFAQGADFRINGEFVKGTQSWFSLGVLQTQENLIGDTLGSFRRPTDQRLHLGAYFGDHMKNDPTVRIYINMVFGSGYPFGPPERTDLRNAFSGDEYYRLDLGFSKQLRLFSDRKIKSQLRLEVLNALGADNTLSYTWIKDVNNNQFAIPNSLSARFLNVRFSAEL